MSVAGGAGSLAAAAAARQPAAAVAVLVVAEGILTYDVRREWGRGTRKADIVRPLRNEVVCYCRLGGVYRGTIQVGKNLPLTQFLHLQQLMGRSCSYLLPRQDGGISQNYVNE